MHSPLPLPAEVELESPFRCKVDEVEADRWLAEITDIPGVMAYGNSRDAALAQAHALAFVVIANEQIGEPQWEAKGLELVARLREALPYRQIPDGLLGLAEVLQDPAGSTFSFVFDTTVVPHAANTSPL